MSNIKKMILIFLTINKKNNIINIIHFRGWLNNMILFLIYKMSNLITDYMDYNYQWVQKLRSTIEFIMS